MTKIFQHWQLLVFLGGRFICHNQWDRDRKSRFHQYRDQHYHRHQYRNHDYHYHDVWCHDHVHDHLADIIGDIGDLTMVPWGLVRVPNPLLWKSVGEPWSHVVGQHCLSQNHQFDHHHHDVVPMIMIVTLNMTLADCPAMSFVFVFWQ